MTVAAAFYEGLAGRYHPIFGYWEGAVRRQEEVSERLILAEAGEGPISVLDCPTGIGTQAIERARQEAARLGAAMTFGVADFRFLDEEVEGEFDAVLSCDNSARSMRSKLRPDGLFLARISDYDLVLSERPSATMPSVSETPEGRWIYFQTWDWVDERTYTLHLFLVGEHDGRWETHHHETRCRAVLRAELAGILREAGLRNVAWQMPETSGYHQPVVTARRG